MNDIQFKNWVIAQKDKTKNTPKDHHGKAFVGDRGYLHFDGRVRLSAVDGSNKHHPAYHILSSTEKISQHKFHPFLREDQRLRKYRDKKPIAKDGTVRKHTQQHATIKNRPIMYASHLDACIYSMYSSCIGTQYEKRLETLGLENQVLAYRPITLGETGRNKSNIDLAKELYERIINAEQDVGILLLDISGFFDNLSHDKLLARWLDITGSGATLPKDQQAIYTNITSFRYVFTDIAYTALGLSSEKIKELHKDRKAILCTPREFNEKIKKGRHIHKNVTGRGIPQGSPISGLLANIYMLNFDIEMKKITEDLGGYYGRYSDDIVALVPPENLADVYEAAKRLIENDSLKISSKKTECFVYQKSDDLFTNRIKDIEPSSSLNLKTYPQYLGFMFTEDGMYIRGNTLARRFRGKKAFLLDDERWKYFTLATNKTGAVNMPGQIVKIRKKLKPLVTEAQKKRAEKNRAKRGEANS